jgi:two-component system, chemotaxis family, chemotaxis protein CheY
MAFSVLIVDDCRAMHTVLRRILTISGFEMDQCYFASDGEDALAVLRRHRIDLVISDINMPRLDGEGMLRRLTEDAALCRIPVVMVTSDATTSRARRLLDMGARAYLTKPFQPEVFRSELERVMESCRG